MRHLFLHARLIDPAGGTDREGHLLVEDGRIADIVHEGTPEVSGAEVTDCAGLCLAPGIIDLGVKVSEPGERHKESFRSAGEAAARGGVTTMVTRPDTEPAIDTPEVLEFVRRRANEAAPVRVLPMAALTKARAGREMVEIGFLKDAGAAAFTDCDRVVENTKVLSRALTYARSLGALVIGHPQDPGLSAGAAATSGKFASLKGLPSVSPMAERIGLDRDLGLVEMTGAAWHADQITTARALRRLSRAREAGLDVTAGVSIHHLTLNEFDVGDYRTFFKVKPPLQVGRRPGGGSRGRRFWPNRRHFVDAYAAIGGRKTPALRGGRFGCGRTRNAPAGGNEALPRGRAWSCRPSFAPSRSTRPAASASTPGGSSRAHRPTSCSSTPDAPFVLDRWTLASKSKNTPFDGAKLEGKVKGTWVGGKRVFG